MRKYLLYLTRHLTLFKTLVFSPTVSTLRDIVHRRVPIISILLPVTLRSERTENSLWDDYFNRIPSDLPHEFLPRTFRSLIYPRPKTRDFSEVSDFRSTFSLEGGPASNDPIVNGIFNKSFNIYHQEVLSPSNMRRIYLSTSMYVMGHPDKSFRKLRSLKRLFCSATYEMCEQAKSNTNTSPKLECLKEFSTEQTSLYLSYKCVQYLQIFS